MPLKEEFEVAGNWLFRWRSYLPLVLFVLVLLSLKDFSNYGVFSKYAVYWQVFCLAVSMFGMVIRGMTIGYTPKGTSGRNTKAQRADVLNTSGIYSIVRHPLYVGNYFCWLGISMFFGIWWLSLLFSLIFWIYYERIMYAEEEFLRKKFGDVYEEWSNKTPAFMPAFRQWRTSELTFSFKNILKREYSGFFAIIASFTVMDVLTNIKMHDKIFPDKIWLFVFIIGLLIYLILRTLKKTTTLFDVKNR